MVRICSQVLSKPRSKTEEACPMSISHPIALYLNREHAVYSTLAHERAFTAQREAAVTRVPGRHWAKSVVCIVDEAEPVLAVVPADLIVNMKALLRLTSGRRVRLATEDEVESLFPECEVGAMPPFGSLVRVADLRGYHVGV
jgi:prolyl-tRNA editing enzyme YbaK/EbsC (Cys-tRNA(Pro) deacylase)